MRKGQKMQMFFNIVSVISSVFSVLLAFCALKVAKEQLGKIIENQKIDALKIVLEIEAEMNLRKCRFDEASLNILKASKNKDGTDKQGLEDLEAYFNTTKENYFNIVDRFCYCIEKKYIDDLSWRVEYRNYIKQIVEAYPEDFNSATSYRHIKRINDEWQST